VDSECLALWKFENLQDVSLTSDSTNSLDAGMEAFLSQSRGIRSLLFRKCAKVTNRSIESLSRYCEHIVHLDFGFNKWFNDQSLAVLSRTLPTVRILNLQQTSITSKSIELLVQQSRELIYLNISRCDLVNDEGLSQLVLNPLPLKYLWLSDNPRLSGNTIRAVIQAVRTLELLDLENTNVRDDDLIGITSGIRIFSLSGCSEITDRSVAELTRYFPYLEMLDLWCTKITNRSLIGLAKYAKCLRKGKERKEKDEELN
jgi:hypothetical protein